jgi:hypothetical protein
MNPIWESSRDYLPPTEVGKMHLALSITNLSQFVTYDSYIPDPIVIQGNEQWNYDARTYRNIVVNNSKLDINCVLRLPPFGQNKFDYYSVLNINEGLELEGVGEIIMNATTTLKIDNNANIKLHDNSKVEMKDESYICIEQGATLNLVDGLSVINLRPGYIPGVNTAAIPDPGNCQNDPKNAPISGNGSINVFTDDIYIQYETISSDRYITGENIYVGRTVTTAKPIGDVVINNNAKVIFEGTQNVSFEGGFELNAGSTIEVK